MGYSLPVFWVPLGVWGVGWVFFLVAEQVFGYRRVGYSRVMYATGGVPRHVGGGGVVYARVMVSLFWGCGEGGFGVRFVGVGVNFLWC